MEIMTATRRLSEEIEGAYSSNNNNNNIVGATAVVVVVIDETSRESCSQVIYTGAPLRRQREGEVLPVYIDIL